MYPLIEFIRIWVERFVGYMQAVPCSLVGLLGRVAIAGVFWRSGQTKVDGFALKDSAVDLFRDEYQVPFPEIAAPMATVAEHLFPILLVIGLATRFSALGLFVMTLVIQWVYPSAFWTQHILWFALLSYLIVLGPGNISIDAYLKKYFSAPPGGAPAS